MTTNSNDTNPYCSPSASSVSTEPARRCFPWRIIPVIMLCLYGGLMVLESMVWLFMVFGGCCVFISRTHLASDAQIWVLMLGTFLLGVHGCFAIAVGRYLWKQCWRRSIVAFAGAIVLLITASAVFCIVPRLPPGRQWRTPSNETDERVSKAEQE